MSKGGLLASLAKGVRDHLPFQRQTYGVLRRIGLPDVLYRHLPIKGWMEVRTRGGPFRMFSYGDVVENAVFWSRDGRGDDAVSFQVWERLSALADGSILDIGANTGLYALIAKTIRRDATVVAFEPVGRIAEKLARNIAENRYDIEIVGKAVSDHGGVATFYDSVDAEQSNNRYSASLETGFAFNTHSYSVEIVTIDELPLAATKVSLIKLDVEMHEAAAVKGMMAMIERDRPSFIIEVLNDGMADALTVLLSGLGYRFFSIDESRGLLPGDRLRSSGAPNYNNLVCLPEIADRARLAELVVDAL